MHNKYMLIGVVVGVLLSSVVVVLAGQIDSPGAPDSDGEQQMYTLEQIYDRLDSGAETAKMTSFTEPASGPGSTMHTLDEIMAKAPAVDDTDGAIKAEVANGKKYWSLRTDGSGGSSWGLETGQLYGGCTCSGTLNGTRWCDNGDGTVTDLLGYNGKGQCLVWLQNANCIGTKKWANDSTWDDAQTASGILQDGDCGLSDGSVNGDWRLPTKSELVAITDASGTEYVRSGTPRAFTGVQSGYYWSSTTHPIFTTRAWFVYLLNGLVYYDLKTLTSYVWPVRGGQ
jgi:hypothetical protein